MLRRVTCKVTAIIAQGSQIGVFLHPVTLCEEFYTSKVLEILIMISSEIVRELFYPAPYIYDLVNSSLLIIGFIKMFTTIHIFYSINLQRIDSEDTLVVIRNSTWFGDQTVRINEKGRCSL